MAIKEERKVAKTHICRSECIQNNIFVYFLLDLWSLITTRCPRLLQSELYLSILYFLSNCIIKYCIIVLYGKYYIFSGKLDIKEIDKFK